LRTNAIKILKILRINGKFLKNKDINSQSKWELFLDKINIELPQKVEPTPTNKSFKK
jgi:hypothetical protein